MTITWLGHSCFLLEEDGYRLVTDPFEGVQGYPDTHARAHAVYCSHDHHDHNYRAGVTLLPERESPFAVEEVATFHDDRGGALRGTNTIRRFTAGGVTVCHLGDLGHALSKEQLRAIGRVDVLLIPVGGFFTIDAAGARAAAQAIAPRCIVPMHYRHPPYGLEQVAGVEAFLRYFRPDEVRRLPDNTFAVTPELPRVIVPAYRES